MRWGLFAAAALLIAVVVSALSARPLMILSVSAPPSGSGLVAEWRLSSSSITGTTVADASGTGHTATVNSGPLSFGTFGAVFNGSSQYISSTYSAATAQLTVMAWINPADVNTGNPRIVANSHTDTDLAGFELQFDGGGANGFFSVGNGTSEGRAAWTQQLSAGTWYHYAGVYDGATVRAYINGAQVASTNYAGGNISAGTGPNINVARNPSYAGDFFNGEIGDVRIYSQGLSSAQILAIYQQGGPPPPPPQTLPQDVINAGFVTQMFAWDWTTGTHNNLAQYVDACGATGGNVVWRWNFAFQSGGTGPCNQLEVISDGGVQILHMHANSADDLTLVQPTDLNQGGFTNAYPLLSYSEITFKILQPSFNTGTSKGSMFDFWNGPAQNLGGSGTPYYEPDSLEVYNQVPGHGSPCLDGNGCIAETQILGWNGANGIFGLNGITTDWRQYHTTGFLITSNSIGGGISICAYLDGVRQGNCAVGGQGVGSGMYRHDSITVLTINSCIAFNCGGTGPGDLPATDLYVKSVRKFSCPGYASGDCLGPLIQ